MRKSGAQQEIETIHELEKHNVRYIVLPSIAYANFGHFGKFGSTHGQLLSNYITQNFNEVARFGEWSNVSDDEYHTSS